MKIVPKEKASVLQLRKCISFKLVALAQRIYPESDAVKAFHLNCLYDSMIEGRVITRVDFSEFYEEQKR